MSFFYKTEIPLVSNECITFGGAYCIQRRILATDEVVLMDCRQSTALQIAVTPKLLDELKSCGVPNRLASLQSFEFPGIAIGLERSVFGEQLHLSPRSLHSFIQDWFGHTSGMKISLLLDLGTVKDFHFGLKLSPSCSTCKLSRKDEVSVDDNLKNGGFLTYHNLGPPSIMQHGWTDASSQWWTIVSLTLLVTRSGGAALALNRKMLHEENFFDATLIANNGAPVKFHRSVLATHSPVFAAMFKGEMNEAKTGSVEMPGLCESSVAALREYLYAWNTDGGEDPVVCLELLQAGHQYDIRSLSTCMEVILMRKSSNWYTVDVAWRLFNWAKLVEMQELQFKAVHVLKTRVEELIRLPAYQECFDENQTAINDLMRCFAKV